MCICPLCICCISEGWHSKVSERRQLQDLSLSHSFWLSHPTAGLSAPTHTLSLGKCHSAPLLYLLIPAKFPAHPSSLFTPLASPPSPHPSLDASSFSSWRRRQSHTSKCFFLVVVVPASKQCCHHCAQWNYSKRLTYLILLFFSVLLCSLFNRLFLLCLYDK